MVIGLKKNVCQNPKCCLNTTKDRWNKALETYQSRNAYFKPNHAYRIQLLAWFFTH